MCEFLSKPLYWKKKHISTEAENNDQKDKELTTTEYNRLVILLSALLFDDAHQLQQLMSRVPRLANDFTVKSVKRLLPRERTKHPIISYRLNRNPISLGIYE